MSCLAPQLRVLVETGRMTTFHERRKQVEALFHTASELSVAGERESFLSAACGTDSGLRGEVDALLNAVGSAQQIFGNIDEAITARLESSVANLSERPGAVVGPYTLVEKIGEGGMGVVYMAAQAHPVRRKVALKIIKLGMDTHSVVARFEAERQALAMMDHPHMARVLDGGATATGRPYFVMELVPGLPITEFCETNTLSREQRLKLFIPICHAIQSAHQKGIIHRDIKPSNVLVTMHNGAPHPMVIDFGVAKAIDQKLTEKTLFTNFATVIGTPAYMSPEQAEMTKLDVDTRSDIYSLGVLLYELLTGTTPFPEERLRSVAYGEMQRIIVEEEPERPSTRLKKRAIAGSACPIDTRHSSLATDSDWIVMKCLEKDRDRRYETANGLAADIKRHLNCEPVAARPPSRLYEFHKTVRRHKVAFAATAAVILTLAGGVAVSSWQAVRATRAEREQTRLRNLESQLRAEAQTQSLIARQKAYASDMNLVQQALAINNFGRAQELLNRQVPQSGQKDLRGWEWRYLWRQYQSDASLQLCQKTSSIGSMAVSHDGQWLALGQSEMGGLSLWNLKLRQEMAHLAAGDQEVRVAFSPREPLLAFTFESGRSSVNHRCGVRLWNAATKEVVATIPLGGPACGLAFSDDGRSLVVSTIDPDNRITLWSVRDGRNLATYAATQRDYAATAGTTFAVTHDLSVAAHPDTGSQQAKVHLMELATGRERWTSIAADEGITALAFSPDGKVLASGAGWVESDIRLWDVASGTEIARLAGHRGWISAMVFWPDGKTMASASADQTIRLWDISDLRHPRMARVFHGHKLEVWRLALLPDNSTLVSGSKDGSVYFWDTSTPPRAANSVTLPARLAAWRFAADSASIVTLDQSGRAARWSGDDFQERTLLMELGRPASSEFTHLSSDGRWVAIGTTNGVVQVWDLQRQSLLREFQAGSGVVWPIGFLAQGKRMVIRLASDSSFHEWDLASGTETQSWRGPWNEWNYGCAFSPDERQCLMLGFGSGSRLRDMRTGREMPLALNLRQVDDIEFSPDGRLVAAASELGLVKLWETTTFQTVATLSGFMLGVFSAVFSPDGTRLATTGNGSEAVKLWDVESHQDVLTLEGPGSDFGAAAFSPNGVVLGSLKRRSGVLHLWRAPTWSEIQAVKRGNIDRDASRN